MALVEIFKACAIFISCLLLFQEMKIQEAVLFVFTFSSYLSGLADGAKGKAIGEACTRYDECGNYPLSFMRCVNSVCSCGPLQYYEPSMEMCVSKVGEKCDSESPKDDIKLEIKCGENASCVPRDKFGRCRCAMGFRETSDGKCSPIQSRWNSQSSSPSSSASLPSHPKYRSGSNKVAVDQDGAARPDLHTKIESFPYSSAKSSCSHHTRGTLVLISLVAALIPIIPVCFTTS